jgi:hypothetical protein
MAWEKRRNGRLYYFRAERHGNRVRKIYCGGGEKGRLAAAADQAVRDSHVNAAQHRRVNQRPLEELTSTLDEFGELIDRLVTCRLLCSGWRNHNREWRSPNNG